MYLQIIKYACISFSRQRSCYASITVFRKGHSYINSHYSRSSVFMAKMRECEVVRGRRSKSAKMRRRSAKLQRRKCECEHQHRKCQHLTQYISIYKLLIHFCDSMNIFSTFDLHDSKFACNCYDVFRMKETLELAEIINFFLASNVSCIRHCSVFPE